MIVASVLDKPSLMHKIIIQQTIGFFLLALLCAQAYSNDLVTVSWRIKAPYQYLDNGVEKGYLLEQTKQIFAQANIAAKFQVEPAKRIWSNFSAGTKNYCSFDWYKNSEREMLVHYSKAFHVTPPYSVMANQSTAAQVSAHTTLKTLFADTQLTLGLVDSVTYGVELDEMIKSSKNKVERNSVLPMIMARMVAANRASYMFIDKREWQHLKEKDDSLRQTQIFDVKGTPLGLNSYIVCSKDISPEQMQRINDAIQKTKKEKN
jgi:polar amino acid transport system substrate-binding protein